jgi:RHS repeat-associated protein
MWMITDPADQFWNTYSYCGGDPVNFIDPEGNGNNTSSGFSKRF